MVCEAAAQGLHQHLATFVLRPALVGAFTNINPRLNNCSDLTGKLNFGKKLELDCNFWNIFRKISIFLYEPQGIKLQLSRCFPDELKWLT